jgi:hypothetical protein
MRLLLRKNNKMSAERNVYLVFNVMAIINEPSQTCEFRTHRYDLFISRLLYLT